MKHPDGLLFFVRQKCVIINQLFRRKISSARPSQSGADIGVWFGCSVEPPKLTVKTYNKRVVKKKMNHLSYGGDFRAIRPLQIAPENAGNRISEAIELKIFRGSMLPDPPRGYRLRRAFIRTPLRQILDPPQRCYSVISYTHTTIAGFECHAIQNRVE